MAAGELIFDKKSYLITCGFPGDQQAAMEQFADSRGFAIMACAEMSELRSKLESVKHCLGLLVRPQDPSQFEKVTAIAEFCAKNWIDYRVFSDDASIDSKWRVPTSKSGQDYLPDFLKEIFPEKLQELGVFAIKNVFSDMLPDFPTQWSLQDGGNGGNGVGPSKSQQDLVIFCEISAEDFSGGITLRGNYEDLKKCSATLRALDDDSIMRYLAEISNQVLGVISYNLKNIKIQGRIGLPVLMGKEGAPHYRRRSSFYMPSVLVTEPSSGITLAVHYLVPFLKGTAFSRDFNFIIKTVSDDDAIERL